MEFFHSIGFLKKTRDVLSSKALGGFLSVESAAEEDWEVASDRSLQERRLAILNAVRLPKRCRETLYSDLSPVNTFRVVFACLEGRASKLLPDRHFFRAKDDDGYRLMEMLRPN